MNDPVISVATVLNATDLTHQQSLVYDRLKANYEAIVDANRRIGERGLLVLAAGTTLAAALVSGGEFSTIGLVTVGLASFASLVAFVLATYINSPRTTALPGAFAIDLLWDEIINVDLDTAFANIITDLLSAIDIERSVNETNAKLFKALMIMVWLQILLTTAAKLSS